MFILENKEIMAELSRVGLKYLKKGKINEKSLNNFICEGILAEGQME